MNNMVDVICLEIVKELDMYGRQTDVYDYGLPTGIDYAEKEMSDIVKKILEKYGIV